MGTKRTSTKKVEGKKRKEAQINSKRSRQAESTKSITGTATGTPDERNGYGVPRRKPVQLEVRAEDDKVIITLPRINPPSPSSSRKSFVIATTGGVKRTPLLVNEYPVNVVASAFFYDNGGEPPVKWEPLFELSKSEDEQEDEDNAKEFQKVKDLDEDDY